jgi:hypothetical protein
MPSSFETGFVPQDEMLCVVARLPFFMVRSAPEGRVSNHEGLI